MIRFALLVSITFMLSSIGFSDSRNCSSKKYAPLCPDTGATILDETYPTQAFVVSIRGFSTNNANNSDHHEPSEKLPADFITSIFESYGTDMPDIFVPAAKNDYIELIKKVEQNLSAKKMSPEQMKVQLAMIKHIENKSYTWQQDYFESFISKDTGQPVIRGFSSYDEDAMTTATINGFKASSQDCPIEAGEPLKTFKLANTKNAEMGGNIEGLPGGLCMKGNNQAEQFVSQYCGQKESGNHVEIDVSWLQVGHIDEVVKVIPKYPSITPKECSFSILLASPNQGIDVLKQPDYINRDFIDQTELSEEEIDRKLHDIVKSRPGKKICTLLEKLKKPESKETTAPKNQNVKATKLWNLLENIFIKNAVAGIVPIKSKDSFNCTQALSKVSNKQMVELMENDEEFMLTNKLIQEKMEKNKESMKSKLQERLPQCKDFTFIDVPDLFYGHGLAEINGKKELPEYGNISSMLPNPTNSVLANRTLLISDTYNSAFNKFLEKKLTMQGLNTKFVNTWNYAHAGNGNLHCATHSITYCKPRIKK